MPWGGRQLRFKRDVPRKSSRWAVMTRFEVPAVVPDHWGELHFVRWRILQTPWFGIYVHRFDTPDKLRMHDHPWSFVSFVLRGWYGEKHPDGTEHVVRWFNFKRATDAHTVSFLGRIPVWTLVFVGPRRRSWGYIEPDGSWTRFDLSPWEAEFERAREEREAAHG